MSASTKNRSGIPASWNLVAQRGHNRMVLGMLWTARSDPPDYMSPCPPVAERRVSRRVRLRWPLAILKGQMDARVLSSITENLSSHGFRCVVDEPLAAGDSVACILRFPIRPDPPLSQALHCQAQVVWVIGMDDGRFSIGCRIHDYTVVP
jgi:hypothetical protein